MQQESTPSRPTHFPLLHSSLAPPHPPTPRPLSTHGPRPAPCARRRGAQDPGKAVPSGCSPREGMGRGFMTTGGGRGQLRGPGLPEGVGGRVPAPRTLHSGQDGGCLYSHSPWRRKDRLRRFTSKTPPCEAFFSSPSPGSSLSPPG